MKLGILTFHRAHNYGAVLQCYALQEVLKGMGHDVEIINYKQPWIEYRYSLTYNTNRLWMHPKKCIQYLRYERPFRKQRASFFLKFRNHYLNVCESYNINAYDAIIIGSDQLWGEECMNGCLDEVYLGYLSTSPSVKIVGYAISSTKESIDIISERILQVLSNFSSISFREGIIRDYICKITNKQFEICVDPTLLTTKDTWASLINAKWAKRKSYILIFYVNRSFGAFARTMMNIKANIISEKYDLDVIDLSDLKQDINDFVSAIKYASCIITTSFHATVFSLLFERPFYSMKLHDGHDGRYVNILNQLSLNNCLIEMDSYIDDIPNIDYDNVKRKMEKIKKSSMDFLLKNVGIL